MIDWLDIHQYYDYQLPILGDKGMTPTDLKTGELSPVIWTPRIKHEGSYSSSIQISTSGNRLEVSGNPSRFNRLDNLFGIQSIEEGVAIYNQILLSLGLPAFTKATKFIYIPNSKTAKIEKITDGAIMTRIDVTTNRTVGKGNKHDYIKGISTCSYRNSVGSIYPNGKTVDWRVRTTGNVSNLIYPKCYDKSYELSVHALPKIKRKYGIESNEYETLTKLIQFADDHGIVRFESGFKSKFLRKSKCRYYGFHNFKNLLNEHENFLNIDQKMQVVAMDFEHIAERLISNGIVESMRAANTTAIYAMKWSHGHDFSCELHKSQVKTHRARLRKLNIDIANPCDLTKFSPITLKAAREITTGIAVPPDWYDMPKANHLQLVG